MVNEALGLMFEIFQENGRYRRAGISSPSLPLGATVAIDKEFEVSLVLINGEPKHQNDPINYLRSRLVTNAHSGVLAVIAQRG